jgi:predicted anti-sigma-YlaC factor YlaD
MLRCDEFTERVTDYLEWQTSLADRVEVYVHLRRCSDCRRYLGQMKETIRWLGQLAVPPSPAELRGLLARFRRTHLARPASRPNGGALRLVVPIRLRPNERTG